MEKNIDHYIDDILIKYPNYSDAGKEYRKFSHSYFGTGQDPLILSYPNDIELGKILHQIRSSSNKLKN